MMNIGNVVRRFREKAGLSIARLAAKSETSPDYIFRIEHGIAKNIGIEKLGKIAKALEVDLADLIKDSRAA